MWTCLAWAPHGIALVGAFFLLCLLCHWLLLPRYYHSPSRFLSRLPVRTPHGSCLLKAEIRSCHPPDKPFQDFL